MSAKLRSRALAYLIGLSAAATVTSVACFNHPAEKVSEMVCSTDLQCPVGYTCRVPGAKGGCRPRGEPPTADASFDASSDAVSDGAGGSEAGTQRDLPLVQDGKDAPIGSGGVPGLDAATGGTIGSGGAGGVDGSPVDAFDGPAATGGTTADAFTGTGGAGGTEAVGGSTGGGGIGASGGTTSSGGVSGTGGVLPTGGVIGTGGTTSAGGVTGTGGVLPTGGVIGTGGTSSTGGVPGTGGTTTTPSYALTVSFANTTSAGTVNIMPGNTTCVAPTACTRTFDPSTTVTLTAKPTNTGATVTSVLTGWTGACAAIGPLRTCLLTINAATSTTVRFEPLTANLVFATSGIYAGNLGSALAYQTQCNALAAGAGINNATNDAYIAWLAATNYSPLTLLGSSRGWVRTDLLPWIDDMPTALSTGAVLYPVAYDENGVRVIGGVLAGLSLTGTLGSYNCSDWTDSSKLMNSSTTHSAGKGWVYNNMGVSDCTMTSRVLCLMKGRNTPVTATPVAGKRIYLTRSAWSPGGGLASADSKCLADAPSGVVSAKAVLVASNRALSSVLPPATVYVRPDGVKVGTGADIAAAMSAWIGPATIESSVAQDGSGSYVDQATMQLAWTGVNREGSADTDTCRDWTSGASTLSATAGCTGTGWYWSGSCAGRPCDYNTASSAVIGLYCAEQ
jgi:hypothetical protein